MNDIEQELSRLIYEEYSALIAGITPRLRTMSDVQHYAGRLSGIMKRSLTKYITADALPDDTMYYYTAERILKPLLEENRRLVNAAAGQVQSRMDKKAGINIAPQYPAFPEERLARVLGAVKGETAEQALQTMTRAGEGITRSFVDDFVQENAEFRTEAGIQAYIVRTAVGNCCEWCSALAGRYKYPDEIPEDIFRRHNNCACVVDYECGKMRENVHTKQRYTDEQAKQTEQSVPPRVRYTPEQAARKEADAMEAYPKRVDFSGERGIIGLSDSSTEILPEIAERSQPLTYFSDSALNETVQKTADDMLAEVKRHEPGTETARIISLEPPYTVSRPIIGEEGAMTVTIPRCESPSMTIHNHPSGETFSSRDIDRFVVDPNARIMGVIGNNGEWFILEKSEDFDWVRFKVKTVDYNGDYESTVLKEAEQYGLKYYQSRR